MMCCTPPVAIPVDWSGVLRRVRSLFGRVLRRKTEQQDGIDLPDCCRD
ncbi:MAG: hypothetical protein U1E46_11415 [Hyphomicrobiales bacterium]